MKGEGFINGKLLITKNKRYIFVVYTILAMVYVINKNNSKAMNLKKRNSYRSLLQKVRKQDVDHAIASIDCSM